MPLTPTAKKYLSYMRKADAPLSSRDFAYHFKHDVARASRITRELSGEGLIEYFEKLDNDKINRRYFHLPGKPEVKQKEVKQEEVEESIPKYKRLRDVYLEENYEHNMSLVARSFFDFLEKDKKIAVLLIREVAKSREEFKKELKEEGVENVEEEVKKLELEEGKKPKKKRIVIPKTELRRQHIRDMLDTWFPAWAHIQSLPFTNPTAKVRTEEDLLTVRRTGVL